MDDVERFWSKVDIKGPDECWIWKGSKSNYKGKGYGTFYFSGDDKYTLAHRASWILANGPIPDGLLICHTCDNKGCVNPKHLYAGTHSDNVCDREERNPGTAGRQSRFYEGEIWLMKKLRNVGVKNYVLAKIFKTTPGYMSCLINDKRGTNLKPHLETQHDI